MAKKKGKKNASAPALFTKKHKEEEEARTAGMDLHLGPTVSAPSSTSETTKTVIAPSAEGLRRLPFGERKYDSDCGSDPAPEWESEDEYEEDNDEIVDRNLVDCLQEVLEKANLTKFENERHNAKVRLHNVLVPLHTLEKTVTALEAKVSSLEQLRMLQTADRKDL
ncbi:hypothetical protein BDD12DRAFT_898574 [Trichophaea hybrida]|nr:hypothetical protein BDD12DRAFT_898574 [Trichophaea hybrida]